MKQSAPATTRRDLLCAASSTAALFALHRSAGAAEGAAGSHELRPARFAHLRLRTAHLGPMQTFYSHILGLPVAPSTEQKTFTITLGESTIEFIEASGSQAAYHFAINGPENQFAQAKSWLAQRTKLLRDSETDEDERFFESWNAHAVYFADPAGNIGELIARHTLPIRREGEFGPAQMLHVSEIGLVSPDPDRLAEQLIDQFGLSKYGATSFFVGDELGLFVLPPVGRLWIPERRQAAATFPVEVSLRGLGGKLEPEGLPFVIEANGGPSAPTKTS